MWLVVLLAVGDAFSLGSVSFSSGVAAEELSVPFD
jgi:hypothetical protein